MKEPLIMRRRVSRFVELALRFTRRRAAAFLESVYQECLEIEFETRGVLKVPKPKLQWEFKGRLLRSEFQPDVICYGKIVVELKAVTTLTDEHRAQLHNYLKATGHKLGFLVNFGYYPGVEIERIAR